MKGSTAKEICEKKVLCGNLFFLRIKEHKCVVNSSVLSDNLGNGNVADLDSSQHLEENDESLKEKNPKECPQCSKTFLK